MTILARCRWNGGVLQLVKRETVARFHGPVGGALGHLMAETLHGELNVGRAEQRIVLAGVEFYRPLLIGAGHRSPWADVADVKLLWLPGLKALRNLLRKTLGISRGAERFLRENARGLMISVTIAFRAGEARHQYIGTEGANHAHDVS